METRSKRRKRPRLKPITSQISSKWPDLPARFESLNDDTLGLILKFVGNKSYRSFGGLNYHCKEIYITTGMAKETFVFGYGPLSVIIDKIGKGGRRDQNLHERVGKGVVLFHRRDVLDWALYSSRKNKYVIKGICNIAAEEGRIDLLEEIFNNIDDRDAKRCIFLGAEDRKIYYSFGYVDEYAARGGKLDVLKWHETKGLSINKKKCAMEAANRGQLHILKWLREERDLELWGGLYNWANNNGGGHLHVLKWLRQQEVDFNEFTFREAAYRGNLDVLQWLHDEGCSWPRASNRCVDERCVKPEVKDWLRTNGYSDRIVIQGFIG